MIRSLAIAAFLLAAAPALADNYGAIAYSSSTNKYGSAWNNGNEQAARDLATKNCKKAGGKNCKVALWLKDSCGALAVSTKTRSLETSGISWGFNDHSPAKARALQECQKRNKGDECFVVRSVCSLGK